MPEPLKWYDDNADNPSWIKALAEVRRLAPREGWRYQHVQAIIVSIDQYAEAALGNREFFLNKPYGIGGGMKDNIHDDQSVGAYDQADRDVRNYALPLGASG
jgi:hypothetical protein